MTSNNGSWKEILASYYTKVPKSIGEAIWKGGLALVVGASALTGYALYRDPQIITGEPWVERSPTEILAIRSDIRNTVIKLMNEFYTYHRPDGLMFVSWDALDQMRGLWVRPADKFPGKSGEHQLTPDMRVLGGPFLFEECAMTESLAMPSNIMVACPIYNEYDVWGYVAAVVPAEDAAEMMRLVEFLAHRITLAIY